MAKQRHKFMENEAGVHLMHGEFAVCGDAWDGMRDQPDLTGMRADAPLADGEFGEMRETKKRTVTCERCIEMIEHCRHVRTRKAGDVL